MPVTCPKCGTAFSLHVPPGSVTYCPKCRTQVTLLFDATAQAASPAPGTPVNSTVQTTATQQVRKTQGEIEAAVGEGMVRIAQEYMGRGPKETHAHLLGDLLIVRHHGVLTVAEQQLVKTLPAGTGRDLLKQVRSQLLETARPLMEAMIEEATSVKVLSLHHDISTTTGEEIIVFTLVHPPAVKEPKRK